MTQRIDHPFPTERTAIVTGAGAPRGIARTVADTLAEQGWNLVLADIAPSVIGIAEKLGKAHPGRKVAGKQLDISDEAAVSSFFEQVQKDFPPVTGLANVAGIACPKSLFEIETSEFDRVMTVTCRGTMLMMKYAGLQMKEQGVGRIVNFSSITALDGGGTFSKFAYATAKAGIMGLTRGGARELGAYGITVNCVLPGPIDTDIMGGKLTEDRKDDMSSNIPLGRVGQPRDVAAAVAFLLSESAAFVNGVSMNVDGGKYMR